ncbi:MAG: DNA internalization-related competence protein ComEC/Rec2 [Firmicutes bacterium]|nr:DNA internalization-related competence protein ComEC/Rec2 [Bacillota bacterium]
MRKLMWVTLGFGAVCGLCAYGVPSGWRLGLLAAAAGLAVLTGMLCKRRQGLRRAAAALLGCMLGLAWFSLFDRAYLRTADQLDGKTREVVIRAADFSYETDYGRAVNGTFRLEGKPYRLRAYLEDGEPLSPGDTLSGQFRFRVTTPEGELGGTYHSGNGIFLLAYQADTVETTPGQGKELRDLPARLRHWIQEILHTCLPEDAEPFARALLLGDSSLLDYETDTNLKVSGIRHVVAVSGLHVSILFALLTAVTFHKRFLTAAVGFPSLLLFAAVAGFTPSVTRACLMWALVLLALLLEREYDGATALSFAALVMLVCNPLVITSVSFQLSVASVAGIYLFAPGIQSWILSLFGNTKAKKSRFPRRIAGSVSITLAAMVFTTPLCAWYFGTVSLVGVVTNLLALWVISFLFYLLMAVCLLGAVWTDGAMLLGGIAAWPIRYVLTVARGMAHFPLAAVYTRSPYIVAWLVFVYVLLLLFLLRKNRRPRVFACCAVLGLCLALLASWGEPMLDSTRLTVLDVGQGQCILLQSQGRTYMVDCGGDGDEAVADIAAETLLSQGVSRLDGLILTHCDRDHAGAAENLLSRIQAELVILPASGTAPENADGKLVYADRDLTLRFGTAALNIYVPTFPGSGNETSLCLLFDTENCDILITGDRSAFGERMLLRREKLPEVDVLIAGHHGSKNATSEQLLQCVRPEIVCISVGENNPYGHPAEQTLTRLAEFGCQVYRTDENGTICIRR